MGAALSPCVSHSKQPFPPSSNNLLPRDPRIIRFVESRRRRRRERELVRLRQNFARHTRSDLPDWWHRWGCRCPDRPILINSHLNIMVSRYRYKMQKRNQNKSKSSAQRRKTVDNLEDSAPAESPTSSPSDRHGRKRVRWVGKSAAEDSTDTDSEDEIESPEKVWELDSSYIPQTFLTLWLTDFEI